MKKRTIVSVILSLIFVLAITGAAFSADKPDAKNGEISKLTADLISQDDAVRQKAIKELIKTGKPAVPALLKSLKESEIYYGRSGAAFVLGEIGDKSAVPALIKALGDEYMEVKMKSAIALGKLGDKKAVDPIIAAMKEGNYDMKTAGVIALCKIGDKKAVPYIKELEKIQDEGLHKAVKAALEKLK
jgi:HEAT repeat protein